MNLVLITESGSEYRLVKEDNGMFNLSKKGENRSNVLVGIGSIFIENGMDILINELKAKVDGRTSGYYNKPNSFDGVIVDSGDIISLSSIIGSKIFFTCPKKHYMCKQILESCPLELNLLQQNFGFSTKVVEIYIK